jgi:mono/diheme cytochrome c family protein
MVRWRIWLAVTFLVAAGVITAFWLLLNYGFSAKDEPMAFEVMIARRLRHLAVPRNQRNIKNPIPATPEVLAEARHHFADHCAICHGNDGSGHMQIGQNFYPRVPDMRQPETQLLSDGELFYIIHNGIRFTGMPAWGNGPPEEDEDSWKLVHFIRHLPQITPQELEKMKHWNPSSRRDLEREKEIDRFLRGE